MVIILVHWLIRKGSEATFEERWRKMTIREGVGLYREILTTLSDQPEDDRFHTFSIGDPFYTTYINVALWESVEQFEEELRKYMPKQKMIGTNGDRKYVVELEGFEFKLRERAVLNVIDDRGGALPEPSLRLPGQE